MKANAHLILLDFTMRLKKNLVIQILILLWLLYFFEITRFMYILTIIFFLNIEIHMRLKKSIFFMLRLIDILDH